MTMTASYPLTAPPQPLSVKITIAQIQFDATGEATEVVRQLNAFYEVLRGLSLGMQLGDALRAASSTAPAH